MEEKLVKGQWSKERAWQWYNEQPWIRGYNGYPSNCVNRIAMWQEYEHEEVFKQIEYEFREELGWKSNESSFDYSVLYLDRHHGFHHRDVF